MMDSPRRHQGYWAFVGHRVSGLALAIFLPAHFSMLALALDRAEDMDRFLKFADLPLVKFAEWALVLLLSLHLAFGLRLLVLEFLPWPSRGNARIGWIGWGAVLSLLVGALFVWRVM